VFEKYRTTHAIDRMDEEGSRSIQNSNRLLLFGKVSFRNPKLNCSRIAEE